MGVWSIKLPSLSSKVLKILSEKLPSKLVTVTYFTAVITRLIQTICN